MNRKYKKKKSQGDTSYTCREMWWPDEWYLLKRAAYTIFSMIYLYSSIDREKKGIESLYTLFEKVLLGMQLDTAKY
jgi:hypothetical protein